MLVDHPCRSSSSSSNAGGVGGGSSGYSGSSRDGRRQSPSAAAAIVKVLAEEDMMISVSRLQTVSILDKAATPDFVGSRAHFGLFRDRHIS